MIIVCIPIISRVFFFVVSLTYVTTFLVEEHSQSCMYPYQSIENCAQMAGNFRGNFQKKMQIALKKKPERCITTDPSKTVVSFFFFV